MSIHKKKELIIAPAPDNITSPEAALDCTHQQMTDFENLKNHIEMTVTSEGLRIELSESASGTFFDTGSTKLKPDGEQLLVTLAQELGALPNKLSIEGHTDSQPYAPSATYGNWELSADRANTARRVMQGSGIRTDRLPRCAASPINICANRKLHSTLPIVAYR